MKEEYRILGIDFGLKRIGLALTDPLLTFSYPYTTISNDNSLWNNLKSIIEEKNVNKIILGFPKKSNRADKDITKNVLEFKDKLSLKFNLEIILWDESYTSELAKQIVIKSVSKKSKRRDKGLLDQNSAAIILQEYLDEGRSNGMTEGLLE
ncbi:MAG: Holliday junction resolvase RuvX [Ignavibacteriaceae bacterium]